MSFGPYRSYTASLRLKNKLEWPVKNQYFLNDATSSSAFTKSIEPFAQDATKNFKLEEEKGKEE